MLACPLTCCVAVSMSASRVVSAIRRTIDLVDATPLSQTTETSAMRITVVSALNRHANDQRAQNIRRTRRVKRAQQQSRVRGVGCGVSLPDAAFSFSGVGCCHARTEPMSPPLPANGGVHDCGLRRAGGAGKTAEDGGTAASSVGLVAMAVLVCSRSTVRGGRCHPVLDWGSPASPMADGEAPAEAAVIVHDAADGVGVGVGYGAGRVTMSAAVTPLVTDGMLEQGRGAGTAAAGGWTPTSAAALLSSSSSAHSSAMCMAACGGGDACVAVVAIMVAGFAAGERRGPGQAAALTVRPRRLCARECLAWPCCLVCSACLLFASLLNSAFFFFFFLSRVRPQSRR